MNKDQAGKVKSILLIGLTTLFLFISFVLFVYFTQVYYSSKVNIIIGPTTISALILCLIYLAQTKQKNTKTWLAKAGIFFSFMLLIVIVSSIITAQDRLDKNMQDIGLNLPSTAKPILIHDIVLGSWVDYGPVQIIISVPKEDMDTLTRQLSQLFVFENHLRIKEAFWKSKLKTTEKYSTYSTIFSSGGNNGYVDILVISNNPSRAYIYFDIVFE